MILDFSAVQRYNKLWRHFNDYRFSLGYDRFDARFYDSWSARFTGVDPISDQFPELSTYNYAGNSPIRFIDLHGLQQADPEPFPNTLVQKAAQKAADGITFLINMGAKALQVFKEGDASSGGSNTGTTDMTEGIQMMTNRNSNASGDGQGPDAESSSGVIIEDGEFLLPSGNTMKGAVAKDAPDALQQFRNLSKAAAKAASVSKAIKENNGRAAATDDTGSNSSGTKAVDVTGVSDRQTVGTDTINGVVRTMKIRKSGEIVRTRRPIKQ